MNRILLIVIPVVLIAVILVVLYPVWKGGGFPATKDTVLANVPLAVYHSRALDGEESLFWNHYGGCGFPVHAESQGGFFHQLNALSAWVFSKGVVYTLRWV